MTLIISALCADARIIIADRKESDGQSTKKYHLPTHKEYLLALAGDAIRIDTIIGELDLEPIATASTIRQRLYEIIDSHRSTSNKGSSFGLLVIKNGNDHNYHNITCNTDTIGISTPQNPNFNCYGDGIILANHILRKFNLKQYGWRTSLQYLVAIMEEVSESIDSVGNLNQFGYDVAIIKHDGKILERSIENDLNFNKIEFSFQTNNGIFNEKEDTN